MSIEFLKSNYKHKIFISLTIFIIFNLLFFISTSKKNIILTEIPDLKVDYSMHIYLNPSKELKKLNYLLSAENSIISINERYLSVLRNNFETYKKKISNTINDKGLSLIDIIAGKSIFSYYNVIIDYKNLNENKKLELNEIDVDKIRNDILYLENRIMYQIYDELNLNFHIQKLKNDQKKLKLTIQNIDKNKATRGDLNEMLLSQFKNLSTSEIELYKDQLKGDYIKLKDQVDKLNYKLFEDKIMSNIILRDETTIRNELEDRKKKLDEFINLDKYFKENPDKFLVYEDLIVFRDDREIKKTPTHITNDRNRINFLNLNGGAFLISLLLILLNDIRIEYYKILNGRKKNS